MDAPYNAAPPAPGLLQQSYALDAKASADQIAALFGDANSEVVLRWMGDGKNASVGASEKSPGADLIILGVELKLNSTAG